MLSLLIKAIKSIGMVVLILIGSHIISWNEMSLSEHVGEWMADARDMDWVHEAEDQGTLAVKKVKKLISSNSKGIKDQVHRSRAAHKRAQKKAKKNRTRPKDDFSESEREKLRELIEELNH